jgi:hypothetical protein
MQMRRLLAIAAISLSAVASCAQTDDLDDCVRHCDFMERCRLLPSSLGEGTAAFDATSNCRERCRLSDRHTRAEVVNCSKGFDATNDGITSWCDGGDQLQVGGTAAQTTSCRSLAMCLEELFPGQDATAHARLELRLLTASEPLAQEQFCSALGGLSSSSTQAGTGGVAGSGNSISQPRTVSTFQRDTASIWCQSLGVSHGRVVVVDWSGTRFGEEDTCENLLSGRPSISGVHAGLVQYGIELQGLQNAAARAAHARRHAEVIPAGIQSTFQASSNAAPKLVAPTEPNELRPFCAYFSGGETVVPSQRAREYIVQLPAPADLSEGPGECPGRASSCNDGRDNDRDGLVDCQDPKCACSPVVAE